MSQPAEIPGEYPPEIAQLIARHGGIVTKAEEAAGFDRGRFGKIRTRVKPYSDNVKQRVLAALENKEGKNMPAPPKPLTIPETCPPLLADLIRFKGTKAQAIKALRTHDSTFYAVLGGKQMPPEWIVRAKVAMGLPVIGTGAAEAQGEAHTQHEAPAPQIPPFVPWEKTTKSVNLRPKAGQKKGRVLKLPLPLALLIEKHGGVISRAAHSMGNTSGALTLMLKDHSKFNETWQHKVHNALHGLPPAFAERGQMGEDYDKYSLGLAIITMSANSYDRVQDIAEILSGRLVFKQNTTGGWLIIYKMAIDDLPKFKRLARRDVKSIVCP